METKLIIWYVKDVNTVVFILKFLKCITQDNVQIVFLTQIGVISQSVFIQPGECFHICKARFSARSFRCFKPGRRKNSVSGKNCVYPKRCLESQALCKLVTTFNVSEKPGTCAQRFVLFCFRHRVANDSSNLSCYGIFVSVTSFSCRVIHRQNRIHTQCTSDYTRRDKLQTCIYCITPGTGKCDVSSNSKSVVDSRGYICTERITLKIAIDDHTFLIK